MKKLSKGVSVSVKDKKNERRGETKNDDCLVRKNVQKGQFWLLEESAIDRVMCENQAFLSPTQALMFSQCMMMKNDSSLSLS